MAGIDDAGRAIAGLLTYNPGPGIYSRLERAIEAMPDNVRVQELPGLLKRYKDGVPGWELKAVDLDSVIAGRDVVPKAELLSAVQGRSPVYTHKEMVLGESGPHKAWPGLNAESQEPGAVPYADLPKPSRIGSTGSTRHGQPVYKEYGQGGEDYTELLLAQPIAVGPDYGNHWSNAGAKGVDDVVAHARYDTHGDALRINELQSDLGIYNRKQREQAQESQRRLEERGVPVGSLGMDTTQPFPLEDSWSDLLIKRLALEAARQGHRAIEVASPSSVFAKTGNRYDADASLARMEHFYGKVIPGAIERLGRKMGGLTEDTPRQLGPVIRYELPFNNGSLVTEPRGVAEKIFDSDFRRVGPKPAIEIEPRMAYDQLEWAYSKKPESVGEYATLLQAGLANRLRSQGMGMEEAMTAAGQRMPELVRLAEEQAARADAFDRVQAIRDVQEMSPEWKRSRSEAGRRYIMSDEMRRRLIEQGVGASVLAPLLATEEE